MNVKRPTISGWSSSMRSTARSVRVSPWCSPADRRRDRSGLPVKLHGPRPSCGTPRPAAVSPARREATGWRWDSSPPGSAVAVENGRRFVLYAGFEVAVDGLQEVLAVESGMEAEDGAAEHALEQLLPPGTDAEGFGIGPGNVPERDDRGPGQDFADHPRQEGEMVVLHEDHRVVAFRPLWPRHRQNAG